MPSHPNAPDPSADCPRCNYFRQHEKQLWVLRRETDWPLGIDQGKALEILTRAFPKSYGSRER